MKYLSDTWAEIKKWWSLWAASFTAIVLVAVPVVADQWPDLVPGFVALFPKHGQQWAPVIGLALTVAARIISQAAIMDGLRKLFGRKKEGQ